MLRRTNGWGGAHPALGCYTARQAPEPRLQAQMRAGRGGGEGTGGCSKDTLLTRAEMARAIL